MIHGLPEVKSPKDLHNYKIGLIAPFPPPWGGMAVQAEQFYAGLKKEGFVVVTVRTNSPFPSMLGWVDQLWIIRAMLRFCGLVWELLWKAVKVDVLHIFSNSYLSFFLIAAPAVAIGKLYRKKVIINYRGGYAESFFKRWGWLAKPFLSWADCLIVPSPFLVRIFAKLGYHAQIVPNIVSFQHFFYRERSQVRPVFIVARNLEKIYNIPCVIQAFQEIHALYPEAQLWIAGTGSERAALEQEVQRLGLSEAVTFLGQLRNEELPELYQKADISLNGSNVDNTPVAILEAFAAGLPIVSTRAGGIPDMVEHGKTGLLVPLGDPHAMAEAILTLLKDPELCRTLSRNGRSAVEKNTWDYSKKLLLDAYEGVNGHG